MKLTANQVLSPVSPQQADKGGWTQLLRIMKLTTIIILAACLHVSAKGVAQQTITFSGKEVNLENVFNAIKKQTNYRFFFNTDMLKNASKVTIEVKNAQIEQVMNLALKDQPLTFAIKGRTIFIMKKPEEEKRSVQVAAPTGDPITVSGRVTDDQGQPLAGASVRVKGSSSGATTDAQGRFTLNNVDPNATLEVSFVGHETQLLSVKGKTVFSVALGQKVGELDETVVIAYGTTTKRFTTGNVSSVKAVDIERQPVQNPLLALQGRVPGLVVTQNTGVPGGGMTVRVQGQNSINNGSDPLIIIDGVPYPSQLPSVGSHDAVLGSSAGISGPGGNGNPLNYINPLDIESIEILKDADATAIYGSRAANGAILITTKKGKTGKTKLDINGQHGWGNVTKTMKMLNRRQYLDMRYEAYKNDGVDISTLTPGNRNYDLTVWDTTRYTDWQEKLIGGTAKYSNINLSVSGGTATIQYLIGGTYNRTTTVFPGDFANQKGSLHFNIGNISADQRFRIQLSSNFMADDNKLPGIDLTRDANLLEPVAPELYNPDGTVNWADDHNGSSTWEVHPLANILYSNYSNKTNNLVSNLQLGYTIIKGLEIKSSFGYTYLQATDFTSVPLNSQKPEWRPFLQRSAIYGSRLMRSWIIEPHVIYKKQISKGRLEALIGSSIQQSKSNSGSILGEGYTSDQLLLDYRAAGKLSAAASLISEYKYNALFGRLNYNWNDKYIINFNVRRDGSSRFGAKNRFHNFGSVGAAWIFSEEGWLKDKLNFFSFGKIRGSYGTTGSDQIPDYQFLSLYATTTPGVPYQGSPALFPAGLPNPYLQWEETKKLQLGIDLGFINDRILISATYARNRSSNQLIQYILSTVSGNNSITENFPAKVQNTSLEFLLNTINIKGRGIEWTSTLNLTVPSNKLLEFPNIEKSTYSKSLKVGYPLFPHWLYRYGGVDPTTGLYQLLDIDGNPTITPDPLLDKSVLITRMPKFYGGFQNRISYKAFELDFLFQFVRQKGIDNYFNNGTAGQPGLFLSGSSNQPVSVLGRWQKPGDNASIQKFSAALPGAAYDHLALAQISDLLVADASYIRLKNASLSWKLPDSWQRKVHLKNFRVFVQGQNLLTITNYDGADPENQGYTALPPLRIITLGIHVGF